MLSVSVSPDSLDGRYVSIVSGREAGTMYLQCIYNVSGSMTVDTVCIVSIVSGAEADTLYLPLYLLTLPLQTVPCMYLPSRLDSVSDQDRDHGIPISLCCRMRVVDWS